MADDSKKTLLSIQYLRAIAALSVAYFHNAEQIPAFAPIYRANLFEWMHLADGVDVFFVISGFIMVVTSRKLPPVEFLIRRIIRIIPLYWLLTLMISALRYLKPELFRTTLATPEFIFKSLLFIPYANPGQDGNVVPILVPGWSLNFEIFFYLVFAAALLLPARWRLRACGAFFIGLVALYYQLPVRPSMDSVKFLMQWRILEFWAGMAVAELYLRDMLPSSRRVSAALALLGFSIVYMRPVAAGEPLWDALLGTVIPAGALILGAVAFERWHGVWRSRFLQLLGDASYSIYLTHIFTLGIARALWMHTGMTQPTVFDAAVFAVFSMTLTILGSILVYRLVEQPITAALQRLHNRSRQSRAVTSGAAG